MPRVTGAGIPDTAAGPCQARAVGRITYVGHATTLVELDGVALLTDPLLRDRFGHVRRIAPAGRGAARASTRSCVSHAHRDHLDLPSLRRLPREIPAFAPAAVAEVLRREGRAVTELAAGERARFGPVELAATGRTHDGRRVAGRSQRAPRSASWSPARCGSTSPVTRICSTACVTLVGRAGRGPAAGLGLGAAPGTRPPGPGARRPRRRSPPPPGGDPDPLGDVCVAARLVAGRPGLPAREFAQQAAIHAPGVAVPVLAPGESLALERATATGR